MTEHQPIILNNAITVDQTENQVEKELVLKEDYSAKLEKNFKKHMNAENLEFILPEKLEVKDKKQQSLK